MKFKASGRMNCAVLLLAVVGVVGGFSAEVLAEEVLAKEGLASERGAEVGRLVLRPTIFTDLVYQTFSDEREDHTGFTIGHLRPGLVLEPADWFRGVMSLEWAVKNPKVLDAYARMQVSKSVVVQAGYSKTALFTNYADNPLQTLAFGEATPTVEAFRGACAEVVACRVYVDQHVGLSEPL